MNLKKILWIKKLKNKLKNEFLRNIKIQKLLNWNIQNIAKLNKKIFAN